MDAVLGPATVLPGDVLFDRFDDLRAVGPIGAVRIIDSLDAENDRTLPERGLYLESSALTVNSDQKIRLDGNREIGSGNLLSLVEAAELGLSDTTIEGIRAELCGYEYGGGQQLGREVQAI